MRPQRGSRARSMTGDSTIWQPRARASLAATAIARSTSAGFQVAPRPSGTGKCVACGATKPCSASSWNITGIPSRVFSSTHFWTALVNSACLRAPRTWGPASVPPISLGRASCPMPWPSSAGAPAGTNVPWASCSGLRVVQRVVELGDLLLERHPPEQVGHALGHGARGVLVDRRRLLRRQHRHRCGREGQRRGEAGDQSGGTRGGHVDPISLAVRNSRRQQQTGGDTLPQPQAGQRPGARPGRRRAEAGPGPGEAGQGREEAGRRPGVRLRRGSESATRRTGSSPWPSPGRRPCGGPRSGL